MTATRESAQEAEGAVVANFAQNLTVLTVLGFVLSAAPAFAETMDATFGNTVTVALPDGAVDRYFFEPDGSFVERSHDGQTYTGRWVRRGGQVCLSLADRADEDCAPFPLDKRVGDSWAMEKSGGASLAISIVRGRS